MKHNSRIRYKTRTIGGWMVKYRYIPQDKAISDIRKYMCWNEETEGLRGIVAGVPCEMAIPHPSCSSCVYYRAKSSKGDGFLDEHYCTHPLHSCKLPNQYGVCCHHEVPCSYTMYPDYVIAKRTNIFNEVVTTKLTHKEFDHYVAKQYEA